MVPGLMPKVFSSVGGVWAGARGCFALKCIWLRFHVGRPLSEMPPGDFVCFI